MKKILLVCLTAIALSGCGINKQAQQIKALEKCTYKITSAEEIYLAGTNVKKLLNDQEISLGSLPGLALGLFRKDVPLKARLNLEVKNPSGNDAAINQFEYEILINKQELAEGFVNQEVNVAAGQSTTVPVDLLINLYPFISNSKVMAEITDFIQSGKSGPEKKGILTLKIKPSIKVGNSLVKYPGYITIDKEVSSKILL
ncbi:NDR1/HIN1-like protein [Pedobacter metabolipauper]|uniref:Late embryogenesis abundant protein n=1 Tax=Pedobacter metabolipauper TaxID=425513 RepID=A0A4R6SRC7_9SPHI|nr:LEA type 2 family protein [Pedobacter metabolipauper]TDQ06982.1 late embryogenesis abundant protein [Pedobacter metabolipauper]